MRSSHPRQSAAREDDALAPLARAAAEGERAAAEALLRRLLPRVRNLVRYMIRGDADVDDIAQLALVAILKGLPGYRAEGRVEAWADRITAREALRFVKKKRQDERRRAEAAPDLRVVRAPSAAPDVYVKRRDLARWLDAMPEEQRQAVVLHHLLGMSTPELAEALDVPFDTAKSRLRLGMKKLRAHAARQPGEGETT